MISNCIIVHGSQFKNPTGAIHPSKQPWLLWMKKQLIKRGIKIFIPKMSNYWEPKYEEWKEEFEKFPVDEESVLIGHSCGGALLVRWLGESKKKIKKLILIMPGKIVRATDTILEKFYDFEIDEKIKGRVEKIIIFTSDNDTKWRLKSAKIYHKKLGGRLIELPDKGHFIFKHMKTEKFPELLEAVLAE